MRDDRVRTGLRAALATLLGTLALGPVFSSTRWFPPVLAVVLVVLAGGILLRTGGPLLWRVLGGGRPAPGPLVSAGVVLVPLGQLVLISCLLTGLYAPDTALSDFLPTWDSLAGLGFVFAQGGAEIREQATPALPLTGLVAVTVAFAGLIAVIVDLLAVEGRRAAVGGLALLVLVCVPVATTPGSIGLLALAGPAAGFALLLRTDQQRRLVAPVRSRGALLGAGTFAAVRIGVLALAAGIVLGAVVPTLTEGSFAGGLGGGSGNSTGTSLDPVAELRGQLTLDDPVDLLRLDTSADDPGYLRAVALDEYDAEDGWTLSNLDGEVSVVDDDRLAPLPDGQDTRRVDATIEALGHDDRFLPVPSSVLSVQLLSGRGADWRFDPASATIFGRGSTTAGRTWAVTAEEPRPSPELLASAPPQTGRAIEATFTALPELDPSVTELMSGLISAEQNPYERVRTISDFFTDRSEGFLYSLSTAPGTGGDDLADFLRLRRGYCEQYAGAMAVMVRAAGVPARVALGYTPGSLQDDGSRLITTDDAHAWVEVYFEERGWVPFDPTPIAAGRAVDLPWAPHGRDVDAPTVPDTAPAPGVPAPQPGPLPDGLDDGATTDAAPTTRPGVPPAVLGWLGGAVLLLVLAGTPGGLRVLQRRRRIATGGSAALWDELTATATDLDRAPHPSWTPSRTARELATGTPAVDDALARLARAEERASYGPGGPSTDARLVIDLHAARRALLRGSTRGGQLRAALWPASLPDGIRTRLTERRRARLRPT